MPVTIGKWLSSKVQNTFETPSRAFDFCADTNVYKPLENIEKENAICFVYQPEKPRRCDFIGMKALELIKKVRPDVKIYLYGSNVESSITVECENLKIISVEECNKLYNKCKVGLCMSASNPSRIPFEMMAAGLPVVELYRENNLYDLPDQGVLLSQSTPEAIASSILYLLDHDEERERMSKFGVNYMKDYPLEKGFEQFVKIVDKMLNTDYDGYSKIDKLYNKKGFEASEEINQLNSRLNTINNTPVEKRSLPYRVLRKIYRMTLKKFIKR